MKGARNLPERCQWQTMWTLWSPGAGSAACSPLSGRRMVAALAARDGVAPRNIDVRALQRALLADGFYLGDSARLEELGLNEK